MMRTLTWACLVTVSGLVLWFVPTPISNASVDEITRWFASARPDQVAVVLVRSVATLWWLRAATSTAYLLVATLADAPDHIDSAVARLPALGRRLVRPIAVAVVATTFATATPAIGQELPDAPETPISAPLESDTTPTREAPPTLVMTRLPDTGWPDYSYPTTISDLDNAVMGLEAVSAEVTMGEPWIVERGDHLWSIAQRTAPADASLTDVGKHWLAIIELNRSNLPDANNPDLIYPGDVITIPRSPDS